MTGKLQRSLSGHHVSNFCNRFSCNVQVALLIYGKMFSFVLQATTSYPVENSVNSYLHTISSGSEESQGTIEQLIKRYVNF